jgi:hypothetical protein
MRRPDYVIGRLLRSASAVMLSEACGEWRPMPAMIYLYEEDPYVCPFLPERGCGHARAPP